MTVSSTLIDIVDSTSNIATVTENPSAVIDAVQMLQSRNSIDSYKKRR